MKHRTETRGRPGIRLQPSPEMSSFGIWLVTQMNECGFIMADIHRELGTAYSCIKDWIYGRTYPRITHLIEICDLISRQTEVQPMQLLSTAIYTFDESMYAQRRWVECNPAKASRSVVKQGLCFKTIDKLLESDIQQGLLVPGTDLDDDGSVIIMQTPGDLATTTFFRSVQNKTATE